MLKQGDILAGRYQIIERIGQGGTGIIYKAYDRNLQKYVVLKKIKDDYIYSLNNRAEADILKRLHHPYLPQVYDFITAEQKIFTVIDYIDGKELKWFSDNGQILSEGTLRRWMEELLEALSYLHHQTPKIIHGDIKPVNIMVGRNGQAYLIDFNISLGDGDMSSIYGISRDYAAPEQIEKMHLAEQGRPHHMISLDERTDIFSLGKSFYKQMKYGSRQGAVYSQTLWEIVEKAMRKDPKDRYKSADRMLYAIGHIEQLDHQYRRYYITSLCVHCAYALCLIAAVFLIYFGYRTREREKYQEAFTVLTEYAQSEQTQEMISEGIRVLNMSEFRKRQEEQPGKNAAVFHIVGDGYYLEEEYKEASEYYQMAVEAMEKGGETVNPNYYVDYGAALARAGRIESAKLVHEEAKGKYISSGYAKILEGEIFNAQGEKEQAESAFLEASQSEEADVRCNAVLKIADLYEEEGEFNRAIDCLKKLTKTDGTVVVFRRLGNLYHMAGRYKEASLSFQELIDVNLAEYEDYINYAVCCESMGDYSRAQKQLKEMSEKYPQRYESYMHLAFSYYKLGKMSMAEQYYEQAKERHKNNSSQDSMMEELAGLLE